MSDDDKIQAAQNRATNVVATRRIERKCCRNCRYFEWSETIDSYTGDDLQAWGCILINNDDEAPYEDDEVYILQDDIGLPYLMSCGEFEAASSPSELLSNVLKFKKKDNQ